MIKGEKEMNKRKEEGGNREERERRGVQEKEESAITFFVLFLDQIRFVCDM